MKKHGSLNRESEILIAAVLIRIARNSSRPIEIADSNRGKTTTLSVASARCFPPFKMRCRPYCASGGLRLKADRNPIGELPKLFYNLSFRIVQTS
jgi:hypothetical protein